MRPVCGDALAQLAPWFPHWNRCHDPVEPTIQVIQILRQGGILQSLSSSSDGDGAQQQSPEWRAECGVAALDRVGRIAQKVRQTDLPKDAMATLAPQHVGEALVQFRVGGKMAPHPKLLRDDWLATDRIRTSGHQHSVQHRHADSSFGLLGSEAAGAQPWSDQCLVATHCRFY